MKAFLSLLLASVVVVGSQNTPSIQVNVGLVSVDAEVTDATGRFIGNLTKNDFIVLEDGTQQDIASFALTDVPYRALALVDCTGSLIDRVEIADASLDLLARSLRPSDAIAVASFGKTVESVLEWTPARRWQPRRLAATASNECNDTYFYGSLVTALESMKTVPGRRSVVVISDGIDSLVTVRQGDPKGSPLEKLVRITDPKDDPKFQKVLKAFQTSNVPFYFIALNTDLNPAAMTSSLELSTFYSPLAVPNLQQIRARLQQLAEASKGAVVFPKSPEDVTPLFKRIQDDMGTVYSLGFNPRTPNDGKEHRIEVRVVRKDLRVVKSRDRYKGQP